MSQLTFSQNLIKNGGFEDNIGIPNLAGQYYLCDDWENCFGFGSPDYYHLNGEGPASLPNNYVCDVLPFSGSAAMGIFLYESDSSVTNFREYLNQELENPLIIGQNYRLTFYISNGKAPFSYGGYACDNFSVAFSTEPLFQPLIPNSWVIDFNPQFTYEGYLYNNDWQRVSYEFKADSSYQHITFGSFVNDADQQIMLMDDASQSGGVNYFIDEVSLEFTTSINDLDNEFEKAAIYPNPFTDYLFIETTASDDYTIIVYDSSGREIMAQPINSTLDLNTTNLKTGVYYYQLMKNDVIYKSDKLVKLID